MKRKLGFYRGLYWGNSRVLFGLYRANGKENGNYYIIYKGHIWVIGGTMEKNMETTITGYIGFRASGLEFRVWNLQNDQTLWV